MVILSVQVLSPKGVLAKGRSLFGASLYVLSDLTRPIDDSYLTPNCERRVEQPYDLQTIDSYY